MERTKAKEAAKKVQAAIKAATVTKDKATVAIAAISEVLEREEIVLVAGVVTKPLYDARTTLQAALDAADLVMNFDGDGPMPQCTSPKDLATPIATAKKAISWVTNVIATIVKSQRG